MLREKYLDMTNADTYCQLSEFSEIIIANMMKSTAGNESLPCNLL